MILIYISICFYKVNGQNINTAIRDLQDQSWNIDGWTRFKDSKQIQQNYETDCQVNLMPIRDQQYLKKTYSISDLEYNIVYIEMEIYFIKFIDSAISIYVNQNIIYQNTFLEQQVSQITLCGSNFDSMQTLFQGFYEKSQILQLEISYQQINKNANSYIGIRNLNIYTNGIPLLNGCPFDKQFIQTDGSCVQSCNQGCQYLSGPYLRYCTNDVTCNSKLLNRYLTTDLNKWRFPADPTPSVEQLQYLKYQGRIPFVINNNYYLNVMSSALFSYNMAGSYQCVVQNIQSSNRIQIQFIFYIIGEWGDDSTVNLQIFGQNVQSNGVRIYKQRSTYISTTQSQFYFTNLTNSQGQQVVARKTQITHSANYYSTSIKICFNNLIKNQGAYGYGDFFIYEANTIPNALLYGLYGIIYSCSYPYFAYFGTCILQCPPYSVISTINGNCTDFVQTDTQIYNPLLKINSDSIYITKSFYDIQYDELFQIKPLKYKNQQNGQFYQFVNGKKIIGGYGCWGYGTYGIYVSQLSPHYKLRIYFTLYLVDDWKEGDNFSIYVDGQLIIINSYTQIKQEQLQGETTRDQKQIQLDVFHSLQTSQILFVCNLSDMDSLISSCGISDIFILIDRNSDQVCLQSDQYLSYFTFQCETCNPSPCIFYPGYNTNKCTLGCIDCQSNICYACDYQSGFQLLETSCFASDGFFTLQNIPRSCHYQCSTCVGQMNNQCQSCDNTRLLSDSQCICKDNYVDVFSLKFCQPITSNCHYSCQTCYGLDYYQCVTCDAIYFRQISIQSYTSEYQCMTNYFENGEKQCLYQYCHQFCLTCIGPLINNCLSCRENVTFVNGYCLCFDNVNTSSTCIDCNSEEGIIIQECKYANPNDGVWTYGEQCDNGNQIRSGCLNNKIHKNYKCINTFQQPSICYKCPENCDQCEQIDGSITCTQCNFNYFNSITSCIKCVQSSCKQCWTPYQCDVCFNDIINQNGQCQDCNGYSLINDQCQSICGDGIKTINEQCDDGNLFQFDGCNQQCTIDLNYYCSTQLNQQSTCSSHPQPYLILNEVQSKYQSNLQSYNIISSEKLFQSNVQLQIKSDIQNSIKLEYHIDYQDEEYYFLQIYFNLTFQQSIQSATIQIIILSELSNIYNQTIREDNFNISLENIYIMNEYQQSINQKLSIAGVIAVNALSYSIFPTLLIADISSAILLLNLIKQLQYIQYINIEFPPNINEFLKIFNGVLPLKLLQFDFFQLEISYQRPYQDKFQQFDINASLINKIIRLIPLIMIGCLLNHISNFLLVLIFNFLQTQCVNNSQRIHIYLKNIQQQSIKAIRQFRKIGLLEVSQSYQFEITFYIILQLSNFQNYSIIDFLNNLVAILLLLKYFKIIIQQESQQRIKSLDKQLVQIRMIQAFLFQFAIILLQEIPLCQIIIISLNSFVMLIYIIQFDLIKQKTMRYIQIIQELTLSIATLTLLSYIYLPIYIDPITLGWFQIYLLLQMITIILLIQIYQLGIRIKKLIYNK